MAVTLVSNLTTIWDCESTTGAVGNKPALETEIIKQGANSVDFTMSTVGTNNITGYNGAGLGNLSGQHFRGYYTSIVFPNIDIKANGGIRFYATDGTNTAYWNIAGKDTYTGGWLNVLIDLESVPDSGTVNTSAITELGFYHTFLTSPKNQINGWIDYFRYGSGYTAYGTFELNDVYLADNVTTNADGIVEYINPVYFVYGALILGRTSEQTVYTESGTQIDFANAVVSDTLYGIQAIGNTLVTSTFSWTGCVFSTGSKSYYLDLDDTNIASLTFTGNTVQKSGLIHFLADSTRTAVTGNVFDGCGEVYPQGATFENNTISNTVSSLGAIYLGDSNSFTNSKNITINNYPGKYAVYIPASVTGTITLDAFIVDSSGTDVYWAGTSGTLTINLTNGSNLSTSATAGGIVSIQAAVTLSITVKDTSGNPIQNANVIMQKALDKSTIISGTTNSSGVYSTSINYTGDTDFVGWARQMDLSGTDYDPQDFSGTITVNGASVNVKLAPISI